MSNNKKYYYLKLKDNFFDSDEMLILEGMQDGYKYSNILLKLYLRSLKNEGRLMFNNRIPFNATMLAQVTRHSVGDIEKAVQNFKDLGLIEILDNGAIYITDIQNFIGRSSTEADRKRQYRKQIEVEKNGLIENRQMSRQMSDKNTPELEIEKERELEKDIGSEKEKEKTQGRKETRFSVLLSRSEEIKQEPQYQDLENDPLFADCIEEYTSYFGSLNDKEFVCLKVLAFDYEIEPLYDAIYKVGEQDNVKSPIGLIAKFLEDTPF